MGRAILGRKIGMTQLFEEDGLVHPVTVIEAGPCVVVQKKHKATDGEAIRWLRRHQGAQNKPMAGTCRSQGEA